MGPDNLCVHSFNKYLPSMCYILGLQVVTEIYSDKQNRPSPRPQGAHRIVLHIPSYSLALSINLFHR